MEPAIRVSHLGKKFRVWKDRPDSVKTVLVNLLRGKLPSSGRTEFDVLDDVSFDIAPGEFVGIMGANGAGKSTLLKLISGIYVPSAGHITVNGTIAPLIELGAGFHPDLSGYENIFLNAAILGVGRKAALEALPRILEFSELGDHIHRPIKNYSSGMMVRLGFSVAIQLDAPILLVDEILAVGDMAFQEKCMRRIHEIHDQGRTIILITHNPEAVRTSCTRCIVINNKKKVFDGSAGEGADIYIKAVHGQL